MEHSGPMLDRARLVETLTLVLDHGPPDGGVDYRLVGTGAAMLHGVDLPVGDLDLLFLNRAGVDAFSAALAPFDCLEEPAWLSKMRQYYANYDVNGVEVGLSTVEVETESDVIETFGPGPWKAHYSLLPCDPYLVPTVNLELRLITELYRDRPDRYTPLIAHLQKHGCDLDLVRRGLSGGRLPQDTVERVLCQLAQTTGL
jgi:hypothetical protein